METITDETKLERVGFCWREENGVRALSCAPLERDGFANAFSTRLGGVSQMPHDALNLAGFDDDAAENIHENRRRFLQLFDEQWTLAVCWQVHGADVRVVRDISDARADEERCDGLISNTPGVLLGVKSADCVPVILGDPRTGACASVHAGWRGTVAGIVPRAIERMRAEFGTAPSDVRAAIGPAALACCYEVGAEVIDAFHRSFNYADELFTPTRDGHARIDLHEANCRQLIEAGVEAAKIHTLPLCTMCRTDLFFSYRREKSVYGRTGRLLSVIGRMGAARE
ncbi:MAG: peptidoglycan editing factor PgeF [Acidobacteriota bacterium]|nr:peptidoglycan editing factor PgeF [Acidobacteriota bacterium]